MHKLILVLLSCLALGAAEPQYKHGFPAAGYYLRSGGYSIGSLDDTGGRLGARLFFPTATVTLSTTTTTTTATTTITCTQAAAGLAACSPTGRRRRGRPETLYNEDEDSFLIPLEPKRYVLFSPMKILCLLKICFKLQPGKS